MKNLIVLSFFCMVAANAPAQKIRFTDPSNVWYELGSAQGGSGGTHVGWQHRYHYNGDTLMNGYQYRKLFDDYKQSSLSGSSQSLDFIGYVREDTIIGKVYIAGVGGVMTEKLVIDYNLEVGDTVHYNNGSISKVYKKDSISINGVYHKLWELRFWNGFVSYETYNYIEGIGDSYGVAHTWKGLPNSPSSMLAYNYLMCFENKGTQPPLAKKIAPFFDNLSSCDNALKIEDAWPVKRENAIVVPHPANESGYIQLPYQLTGTITIINQLGQVVRSERILNKDRWTLEGKIPAAGLYIYHIRDEGSGEQLSGKLNYQ